MAEKITLRPEVQWFAEQMEMQLRANDWKGGWKDDSLTALIRRVREETAELQDAISPRPFGEKSVVKEAADVANFAMMIADNYQRDISVYADYLNRKYGEALGDSDD